LQGDDVDFSCPIEQEVSDVSRSSSSGNLDAQEQIQMSDKKIAEFLQDLKSPDVSWEKCSSGPSCTIFRKKEDDETGIYRLKLIGKILHPAQRVDDVLFRNDLRVIWDKVISEIVEAEALPNGASIMYIASRSPFPLGIAHRDFVHIRTRKEREQDKARVVLDISTIHQSFPKKNDYVRAETIFSGGVLESMFCSKLTNKTTTRRNTVQYDFSSRS